MGIILISLEDSVYLFQKPFDDMLIHGMGVLLPFPIPLHPLIASFPGHSWQFVQHPHISFGVILFAILKHHMIFTCENSAD